MIFNISRMRQLCLLIAVFMLASVIGRSIDDPRKQRALFTEDNAEIWRRNERKVTAKPVANAASEDSNEHEEDTDTHIVETTRNLILNGKHICGQQPAIRSKRQAPNRRGNVDENEDGMDKVLGGIHAAYGDVPWHASLFTEATYLCGGAIISEHWIITTAYCVMPIYTRNLSVVVGDNVLGHVDPGEQTFFVEKIVIHENHTWGSYAYDIAILKIKLINGSGIKYNNFVQPICLPRKSEVVHRRERLGVTGLGYLEERAAETGFDTLGMKTPKTDSGTSGSESTHAPPVVALEKGEIEGISRVRCRKLLPWNIINRTMDCAKRVRSSSPVCLEDFGEAATVRLNGSNIVIGLVVAATGCLNLKVPVVLVRVAAFVPWITKMTDINGDKIDTVRLDGTTY